MKLGIITSPDAKGIKNVSALGLKYAEFDINGDEVDRVISDNSLLESLKEHGVNVSAVGRWGRNRLKDNLKVNEKERTDEYKLIDFCKKISCPVYICGVNYVEGFSYYENISASIAYLKSLIDYAGESVKICTYNCHWNSYIDKKAEWDIVHGHLKELGIKYDPSHAINAGRDYLSEIAAYGGRVYHIHLKGTINIDGRHIDDPPAGLDTVNWPAFLSVFRKHGYDGMLSIEPHSSTWQGELGKKGVEYTIKYFKSLLFES
ncbi:MAG: sugar phosphate isomerase/epimerase [Eubacteriales bacterium]